MKNQEVIERARTIPAYLIHAFYYHLLGLKVQLLERGTLVDYFHGLTGTVVSYRIAQRKVRNSVGDVVRTPETEELWTVELDDESWKKINKIVNAIRIITLTSDMFQVLDIEHNEQILTNKKEG
jgi:hypothetical protein